MAGFLEQGQVHAADAAAKQGDGPNSLGARLHRELDLFGGGLWQGLDSTLQNRLIDHPWTTLAEVAGAGVAGFALARLGGGTSLLGSLGAKVVGTSLTFSFLRDVNTNVGTVWGAAAAAWNSPNHLDQDKKIIANTVTPFLFDTAATMGPGLFGAKFGAIANYSDGIKSALRTPAQESVFRIKGPDFLLDGKQVHVTGSGFPVSADGKIATAFHVADSAMQLSLDNVAGAKLTARPIAGLPSEDVALLQAELNSSPALKPLPLADSSMASRGAGYNGAAIGMPGGRFLAIRTGFFENVNDVGGKQLSFMTSAGSKTATLPARVLRGAVGDPGMSGGPVLTENGQVIGTVMASHGNRLDRWLGDSTYHSPVENVSRLIDMTERAKVPGAAVSLGEAQARLGLPIMSILDRINQGKLDGFMVPVQPESNGRGLLWDWRVLLDHQG